MCNPILKTKNLVSALLGYLVPNIKKHPSALVKPANQDNNI